MKKAVVDTFNILTLFFGIISSTLVSEFEYSKALAERGDIKAQLITAIMYKDGTKITKDYQNLIIN